MGNTSKLKRLEAVIASAAGELEELKRYGEDDFEDETCFLIKKRFSAKDSEHAGNCLFWWSRTSPRECTCTWRTEYTYVAVKVRGGWYVTGTTEQGRKTWDQFVEFLTKGTVTEAWVVTAWAEVEGWHN